MKKSSSNSRAKSKDPKKDGAKKIKKKTSILIQERVEYVDYKDVNLLQRFMSDRSKIRARRVSGNDSQQQRDIATAIKNAREMALLPYARRVTTQRGGRDRGERDRGDRVGRDLAAEPVDVPDVADVEVPEPSPDGEGA